MGSNPQTELRDAVLACLSENVSDDETLTVVEDLVMHSTAYATICGDGMVDFETYNAI